MSKYWAYLKTSAAPKLIGPYSTGQELDEILVAYDDLSLRFTMPDDWAPPEYAKTKQKSSILEELQRETNRLLRQSLVEQQIRNRSAEFEERITLEIRGGVKSRLDALNEFHRVADSVGDDAALEWSRRELGRLQSTVDPIWDPVAKGWRFTRRPECQVLHAVQRTDGSLIASGQVETFGKFIEGLATSGISLSFADLSNAPLLEVCIPRADLYKANLSGAMLVRANLSKAELSYADVSHSNMYKADLSHANLSGANLGQSYMRCVDLTGAELSNVNLSFTDLIGANFTDTNLDGVNFMGANLLGVDLGRAKNLDGAFNVDQRVPRSG